MNLRISIIFLFLVVFLVKVSYAQNLPTSCVNGKVRYGINLLPGSSVVWSVSGGTIINDYRDSVDIQWGNLSGPVSLSYREINTYGCSSTEQTGFVILNAPFTDLGLPKYICNGSSTTLDAGNGFASYRWNDGSTNSNINTATTGIYWVDVTDNSGCVFRDSVTVTVNNLPVVNLGEDQELCSPNTLTLDAGNFGAFYEWSKNNQTSNTIIAEDGDGKIWVKVTDVNGCAGADTIEILRCIVVGEIPNAITPNNDNINDVWHITQQDQISRFPNMVVRIYDRWGRLVFESEKGYSKPWDGNSKGKPLPMDTYYYIINYGDGTPDRVGSVAIIR